MNCINCDHTYTKVLDTRIFQHQSRWMKRRRTCFECGHIFFTLEMPAEDVDFAVEIETDAPASPADET